LKQLYREEVLEQHSGVQQVAERRSGASRLNGNIKKVFKISEDRLRHRLTADAPFFCCVLMNDGDSDMLVMMVYQPEPARREFSACV